MFGEGEFILRIRGPHEMKPRQPLILRMPAPEDFTVHKAQLLNIRNLKSSSSPVGKETFMVISYKVPSSSEYTVKMTTVLIGMFFLAFVFKKFTFSYHLVKKCPLSVRGSYEVFPGSMKLCHMSPI
jgi:hypothetical protein